MTFVKTAIEKQQVLNRGTLHTYFSWNKFLIMPVS